eukprot:jgi/Mesvir1/8362/Mv12616-RA.1
MPTDNVQETELGEAGSSEWKARVGLTPAATITRSIASTYTRSESTLGGTISATSYLPRGTVSHASTSLSALTIDLHHQHETQRSAGVDFNAPSYVEFLASLAVGVDPCSVGWRDLQYSVNLLITFQSARQGVWARVFNWRMRQQLRRTTVIHPMSGLIPSGSLTVVMGLRGASKSTFLRLLAQQLQPHGIGTMRGRIVYKRSDMGESIFRTVSYSDMRDNHIPFLTVRETFDFVQFLRRVEDRVVEGWATARKPTFMQKRDAGTMPMRKKLTSQTAVMLQVMGLTGVADKLIGDRTHARLTPGELRHVSIGEAIMVGSPVLCLVEPQRGLDKLSAINLFVMLNKLATVLGFTVITSAKTVLDELFSLCSHLLLLNKGRCVYFGEAPQAVDYFASIGFQQPQKKDAASFLLEVTEPEGARFFSPTRHPRSSDRTSAGVSAASFMTVVVDEETGARVRSLRRPRTPAEFERAYRASEWAQATDAALTFTFGADNQQEHAISWSEPWTEFRACCFRRMRLLMRARRPFFSLILETVLSALLTGSVYWHLGTDLIGAVGRMLLVFVMGMYFAQLEGSINLYRAYQERIIFYRQSHQGFIGSLPHHASLVLEDLCMSVVTVLIFGCITLWMAGLTRYDGWLLSLLVLFSICSTYKLLARATVALIKDLERAYILLPALLFLMMIFSSHFTLYSRLPSVVQWAYWINPLQYCLECLRIIIMGSTDYNCIVALFLAGKLADPNVTSGCVSGSSPTELCYRDSAGKLLVSSDLLLRRFFEVHPEAARIRRNLLILWGVNAGLFGVIVLAGRFVRYDFPQPHRVVLLDVQADEAREDTEVLTGQEELGVPKSVAEAAQAMTRPNYLLPGSLEALQAVRRKKGGTSWLHLGMGRLSMSLKRFVVPVTLSLEQVSMTMKLMERDSFGVKQPFQRVVLTDITANFGAGTVTAVFCSSLAHEVLVPALAGLPLRDISKGEVLVNGAPVASCVPYRRLLGLVRPTSSLLSAQTIHETLLTAAALRMPPTLRWKKKQKLILKLMHILGVYAYRNKMVVVPGTPLAAQEPLLVRLVLLAVEAVSNASVLIVDEQFSGLDPPADLLMATAVINLALAGRTVISLDKHVAHDIFCLFDAALILDPRGRVVYHGSVGLEGEDLVAYLTGAQHAAGTYDFLRTFKSPVDFLITVVAGGWAGLDLPSYYAQSEARAAAWDENRRLRHEANSTQLATVVEEEDSLSVSAHPHSQGLDIPRVVLRSPTRRKNRIKSSVTMEHLWPRGGDPRRLRALFQARKLIGRFLSHYSRCASLLLHRFAVAAFYGVAVGLVFRNVALEPRFSSNRIALFFVNSLAMWLLDSSPGEIENNPALFQHEVFVRAYSITVYNVCSLLVELPIFLLQLIIFCLCTFILSGIRHEARRFSYLFLLHLLFGWTGLLAAQASKSALSTIRSRNSLLEFVPRTAVILVLLTGGYLRISLRLPDYLRWINYISPLDNFQEAVSIVDLHDTVKSACTDEGVLLMDGDQVLDQWGFDPDNLPKNVITLVIWFTVLLMLKELMLWHQLSHPNWAVAHAST